MSRLDELRIPAVNMPINFTVVPVEDAEGGGSSAAAGGAKADNSVPTVVVEDGDPSPAQDSGTSPTGRTPAGLCFCSGSPLKTVGSRSRAPTQARTGGHRDHNNTWLQLVQQRCVCARARGVMELRVCSRVTCHNKDVRS